MTYQVHLKPKFGPIPANFSTFESETPQESEIIELSIESKILRARVLRVIPSAKLDHIEVAEI
jgi:hypothetical protein